MTFEAGRFRIETRSGAIFPALLAPYKADFLVAVALEICVRGAGYPVVESSPFPGASTTAGGAVLAGSVPSQFQANSLHCGII